MYNDNEIFDEYVASEADWDGLREMNSTDLADQIRELNPELDSWTAHEYAEAIKRVLAQ